MFYMFIMTTTGGGNENIYLLFIVKIILKLKLTLKTATVTTFFIDA